MLCFIVVHSGTDYMKFGFFCYLFFLKKKKIVHNISVGNSYDRQ